MFQTCWDRNRSNKAVTCMLLESGSYCEAVSVSWALAEMDLGKILFTNLLKWAELRFVSYCFFQCMCAFFGEMTLVLRCGMSDTITKKAKSVYWLAVKECWITEWSVLILSFVSVRLMWMRISASSPGPRPGSCKGHLDLPSVMILITTHHCGCLMQFSY